METRTLVTHADHHGFTQIEVTNEEYEKVTKLLFARPLLVVLYDLEQQLIRNKEHLINQALASIESRHAEIVQSRELDLTRLQLENREIEASISKAVAAGKYSEAPVLEAKHIEVGQNILGADLALAEARAALAKEVAIYLQDLADGRQGNGASIDDLDYKAFGNITTAIIWDWLNNNMRESIPMLLTPQARYAGLGAQEAQARVLEAQQRLEEFSRKARSRFSGPASPASPVPAVVRAPGDWGQAERFKDPESIPPQYLHLFKQS